MTIRILSGYPLKCKYLVSSVFFLLPALCLSNNNNSDTIQAIMVHIYKRQLCSDVNCTCTPVSQSQNTSVFRGFCRSLLSNRYMTSADRRHIVQGQACWNWFRVECQHLSLRVCPAQSFLWKQPSEAIYVFDLTDSRATAIRNGNLMLLVWAWQKVSIES